ncbi:hypothetical protein OOK48_35175 [Streptomyces viridodiastaticus]|uniref:hypothetical protein n=1 Tax=Streptomyces albogriseolus TaxID=1887 RepID=UPI00224F86C1|nr:hypothetical protein [Streptomyces viridodiastaticus]MCX4571565.1 hypothetical protein [Streptomyces viridodiastaticus]
MALTQTPAWHAHQETIERAWLDDWARLHTTPEVTEPEPAAPPALATAGSH